MYRSFLMFFLCFAFNLQSYDYYSMCAIFRDEAPYLKEWIEYHSMLGATHFYLYNNESQDNYKEVLTPYIRDGFVTLVDYWPMRKEGWHATQSAAYNDCIKKTIGKTFWLGMIDVDEFIVPMQHDNIPDLLRNYEGAGGLQIFWQFYGTSNLQEIPKGKTMVESLIMKAKTNHSWNYNFKSIIQPPFVKEYKIHGAIYYSPWFGIFPHGTRGGAQQPINIDIVRINHYWTRSENTFRNEKIPSRERREGAPYTEERIQGILKSFNAEKDECILRFVPKLRARMGLKK